MLPSVGVDPLEIDLVGAPLKILDHVAVACASASLGGGAELETVPPAAAAHMIDAEAAGENIIAGTAVDAIIASIALQIIVTVAA